MSAGLGFADRVRALPRVERLALYRALPPGLLASQRYRHAFWARGTQALPDLDDLATIEIVRGGRRAGKTWWAVQLFNACVLSGRARAGARLCAATNDALQIVINGPSGIRTWLPANQRPVYMGAAKNKAGRLIYPDTSVGRFEVECLTAMEPEQARGQGAEITLADDPAKWVTQCGEMRAAETFRQLRISNSEGRPCLIVPTTQQGTGFLRRALTRGQLAGARLRSIGPTSANTALSPSYIRDTIEGLRGEDGDYAAGEFDDEERNEEPGALWKREWIDHVHAAPELVRVVVAVDPADDGKRDSDETGIVVVGLGEDGRLYVLADLTARWSAPHWAAVVAWAYRRYKADAIVSEGNRAWSAVQQCLAIEAPNVPVVRVDATRGKATRAEPLAIQYSAGQVSHVVDGPQLSRPGHMWIKVQIFDPATGRREEVELEVKRDARGWTTLEDELCGWVPRTRRSPNGLDALVWGAWYLKPPDGEGWAQQEHNAGVGGVPGRYHEADARIDPGVGIGGIEGRNADPRWERPRW